MQTMKCKNKFSGYMLEVYIDCVYVRRWESRLYVYFAAPTGLQTIVSHISQHGKSWPYWFRKMGMVSCNTVFCYMFTLLSSSSA